MALSSKARQKAQARKRKIREKLYQSQLKQLEKAGLYQPKSHELTRYRKTQINKRFHANRDFLDKKKFWFVKAPKPARDIAETLQLRTSKTGIFVEREGERRVSLRKSKKRGEYELHLTGKVKRGTKKGKKIDRVIPLTPVDRILLEKGRIEKIAKSYPLKGNQRLAFKVVEKDNEGFSHSTFDSSHLLIKYLERYQSDKSKMAYLSFLRHVEIVITDSSKEWFKEHPVHAKGRRMTKVKYYPGSNIPIIKK